MSTEASGSGSTVEELAAAWHAPMCAVDAGGGCILDCDLKEAWIAGYTSGSAALEAARAEIEQSKARFDEFRSLSAGMVGERFAELRVELQRAQARLAAQERVIQASRAFDSSLSEYCDGPERDSLRAALDAADAANTTMPRPDSGC